MKYEDYMKKYQHQIKEARKTIQMFQDIPEENKRNLETIKERNRIAHQNILEEIETMQHKVFKKSNS